MSYPQTKGQIRLFFQDEATFGRVSESKRCWCAKGIRPIIHKQRVREYIEIFGAVEPKTGDFFYTIAPKEKPNKKKMGRPKIGEAANDIKPREKGIKSRIMNDFMQKLCEKYPNDQIVLICDNAWWHKSQYTVIPDRLTLLFIPTYTPEMNPIEQLWREMRTAGFSNRYFKYISAVEANLHTTISALSPDKIKSITQREWIMTCVNLEVV